MDEIHPSYNCDLVSVIYNTELKEHLKDMKQLKLHLSDVTSIFRQGSRDLNQEEKREKVQEMKEYLEQALASLAFSTTHATQKIDDGLKMQIEDVDHLGRQVKEIALQTEMKKEMKNRLTMGDLSTPKKVPSRSTIKVVDDPHSHWKIPPPRFRRQELDYKILDHVGITGIMTDSNKSTDDQRQRTSRALSIGSQQFRNTLTRTASKRTEEGRHMGTLKRAAMPVLTKPKVKGMEKENPLPEEKEDEDMIQDVTIYRENSPAVVKRKPKLEITLPDDSDDLTTPPTSSDSNIQNEKSKANYRLSNLPAIPDDFMTDIFSSLNQQSSIIEEEIDQLQSDKGTPSIEDCVNPFDDLPSPSEFDFDISTDRKSVV